ncbi:MAG TPA: hypothetical protein VGF93_02000 [Solirubrobacteraceae bacterium]|jgi:hypothetical protein
MADWVTISSLATAGGTLVLAVATFSSVRSANRSARLAERSLLAGLRPILIPTHEDDPDQTVRFGDGILIRVPGHGAAIDLQGDNLYLGIGLRNGGTGLAVIHGWRVEAQDQTGNQPPSLDDFRPQQRDLYVPAGETGFWQGAIRDRSDPEYNELRSALRTGARVAVDLIYGDYEGGQRTIARIGLTRDGDAKDYRAEVGRYWNVDGSDPRERPESNVPVPQPPYNQ